MDRTSSSVDIFFHRTPDLPFIGTIYLTKIVNEKFSDGEASMLPPIPAAAVSARISICRGERSDRTEDFG